MSLLLEDALLRESIICILRFWSLFVASLLKNIIFAFQIGFWLVVDAIKIKKIYFFCKMAKLVNKNIAVSNKKQWIQENEKKKEKK